MGSRLRGEMGCYSPSTGAWGLYHRDTAWPVEGSRCDTRAARRRGQLTPTPREMPSFSKLPVGLQKVPIRSESAPGTSEI